jgi:molecular chaperone DnaK (HSP70)
MNIVDLEKICKDLFIKCIPPIKDTLKDTDLKFDYINEVVLVGGSFRIPKIQKMIEDFF